MFLPIRAWIARPAWALKQLFVGRRNRFYGDGGTIHGTTYLDVVTHNGKVVAVWFRCQNLPFAQSECADWKAEQLKHLNSGTLVGVIVKDE